MSKNNLKNLLKEFKKLNNLDFRIHKYYELSYHYNSNSSTYFNYDFAKKIVINLNFFLQNKFNEKLVIFNVDLDIERLKNQTLSSYITRRINQYIDASNL